MSHKAFKYRIMGDRSLIVELGDTISPEVNRRVRQLDITLNQNPTEGLVETIPTYRSLLIIYDPLKLHVSLLKQLIDNFQKKIEGIHIPEPKTIEIPVVYGGDYGPDLKWVAQYHKMSVEKVIRLHTETIYQVYMIGFTPGHPYMAQLPKALITPRRETPRTNVIRGSVAIGKNQTVIYPVESPGGLHILGRTPLTLFNPSKSPPALLEMGDLVKFVSIEKEEFKKWQ
jgi:inhibitor of KinA